MFMFPLENVARKGLTVYSGAYQRKHQSSASLAFVLVIHSDAENLSIWWRDHDFPIRASL